MSIEHADDQDHGHSLGVSREELLRWDRPFPPYEEMVIEGLTDEEEAAFWEAINEA